MIHFQPSLIWLLFLAPQFTCSFQEPVDTSVPSSYCLSATVNKAVHVFLDSPPLLSYQDTALRSLTLPSTLVHLLWWPCLNINDSFLSPEPLNFSVYTFLRCNYNNIYSFICCLDAENYQVYISQRPLLWVQDTAHFIADISTWLLNDHLNSH